MLVWKGDLTLLVASAIGVGMVTTEFAVDANMNTLINRSTEDFS